MIRNAADLADNVQLYGLKILSLIGLPLLTPAGLVLVLTCLLLVLPATRQRAGLRWLTMPIAAGTLPSSAFIAVNCGLR